jgi:hypothetical protein
MAWWNISSTVDGYSDVQITYHGIQSSNQLARLQLTEQPTNGQTAYMALQMTNQPIKQSVDLVTDKVTMEPAD